MKKSEIAELEEKFLDWLDSLDGEFLGYEREVSNYRRGRFPDNFLFERRDFFIGSLAEVHRDYGKYCSSAMCPASRIHAYHDILKARLEKLRDLYSKAISWRG